MRIRLLVAMKVRLPEGGYRILSPGIYDEKDGSFPEALREESRFGVVEIIDSAPVEMPGLPEDPESEETDLESEETDPEEEPVLEEEEVEEEEVVEAPKKKKIKRRG
jgi:hypothetical protein